MNLRYQVEYANQWICFRYLNNDTVITSPSKNFEISSGARMQLLVGIRK